MKWIVILFSIVCVNGNPLMQTFTARGTELKNCAQGPEYWCQSLVTAKSCGAVKHCIQDVWQHMTLPQDKSEICDTCKKMVAEARAQLQSNETQEEIREVLEGTCKIYFPIKALADECIKYVDEFIPELIEMLVSRMDPQLVCATAGLCNTEAIKQRLLTGKPTYRLPSPTDCQDCKKFMQDVLVDVRSLPKDEVKQKMLFACSHFAQYATACKLIVTENFDMIYNFLQNEANPDEICQLIGMCDETTNIPMIHSVIEQFILAHDPDPECQFCEQLVLYLKNLLTANSTEEEVKDMLLGLCNNFGSLADKCKDFVNDNFQEIYDFLTDELDPHAICNALGVCPAITSTQWIKLTPTISDKKEQSKELVFTPQLESNDIKDAPLYVSQDLNQIEKKIIIKFPFSKKILVKPEDAQLPETRLFPQTLIKSQSAATCALCEYALHELQNILMDNKSTEAIKQALDRVCNLLPKTLTNQCVDFINTYGDAILALIAQQIDPSQVCVKLELCPGIVKETPAKTEEKLTASDFQLPASRLMPNVLAVPPKSSNVCQLCQYIMGIIHSKLQDNKTKEAVEEAMKDICTELPKSMQPKCQKFVDHYGDELLSLLQQFSPSVVCALLNLCSAEVKAVTVPIQDLNMGKCDICQMVVDYLDKLLEEQTVEEEIIKVLENVCKVVPVSAQPQCKTIIETYGIYLLQLLAELDDSKKVCQAIDLCSRAAGEIHLLGGNKCTFGPSYWCQSQVHALACKAVEHCKENVWKN